MLERIFAKPSKVFVFVLLITGLGLWLGTKIPVALYPTSNKPEYQVFITLAHYTPRSFMNEFGTQIKSVLNEIDGVDKLRVEAVPSGMQFTLEFKWGYDPKEAESEVKRATESIRSILPAVIREQIFVQNMRSGGGFFAAAIFSDRIDLTELQRKLEPVLVPMIEKIEGVEDVGLAEPVAKTVVITLMPERLATHRLSVIEVRDFVEKSLSPVNLGRLRVLGKSFAVELGNRAEDWRSLRSLSLAPLKRPGVKLADIADVDLAPDPANQRIWRANGKPSLVLFVRPSETGNLKEICEETLRILEQSSTQFPQGTRYQVLIDLSEFIRAALSDVRRDLIIGGFFASLILIFFVGSFRNSIFSAIEIPLAIAWAMIPMYIFDVSFNLISLGGLALAGGMNVDASIVMVENITRHLKSELARLGRELTAIEKRNAILQAVREVWSPLLVSTFVSLVVFAPLAFTSGLTYTILGDLAKAVIFSHGFSIFIALLVVPAVRLQLAEADAKRSHFFRRCETAIESLITRFSLYVDQMGLNLKRRRQVIVGAFVLALAVPTITASFIQKEILALAKTNFVWTSVISETSKSVDQMGRLLKDAEDIFLSKMHHRFDSTFAQAQRADYGGLLVHLRNKEELQQVLIEMQSELKSDPQIRYAFEPWNPASLPIPDPPDLVIRIFGEAEKRMTAAEFLLEHIRGTRHFDWAWSSVKRSSQISVRPRFLYFDQVERSLGLSYSQLSSLLFNLLNPMKIASIVTELGVKPVYIQIPTETVNRIEDFEGLPLVLADKVLPLKALVDVNTENKLTEYYEDQGREVSVVNASIKYENKGKLKSLVEEIESSVRNKPWLKNLTVVFETADKEVNAILFELIGAFAISLLLIVCTLFFQFGNLRDVVIVFSAIPFGVLGVSLSLFVFDSTWSINSGLGVILLSGIAVNNSILLVAFFKSRRAEGEDVRAAVRSALEVRLKPIIVTSLTTVLGMLPIALGLGEGGEVLRPLGIAVSGGMVFSTLLTIVIVPLLTMELYSNSRPARFTCL